MRYYIKCKLNPKEKQQLHDSIKNCSLGNGKIFYEGMQTALREGTMDDDNIVHFIEICYCLESGLYPMAMEIPEINKYFENIVEIKDARLRNQCTIECEFCDCTRNIRLPGKALINELGLDKEIEFEKDTFVDIDRINLNRKKQKKGIQELRDIVEIFANEKSLKPVFAGAAISGLFAIFFDYIDKDNFRIKNIPDCTEARQILKSMGFHVNYNVDSIKATAKTSLARSDRRSNIA
jgi:hypothetical protein